MAAQHEVRGRLTLRGEEWKRGLDRAGRQTHDFQRTVARSMKLLTAVFVGGALTGAIRRLGQSFIETGKQFDQGFADSIVRFQESLETVRRAILATFGPELENALNTTATWLEENAKTIALWAGEWVTKLREVARTAEFFAQVLGFAVTGKLGAIHNAAESYSSAMEEIKKSHEAAVMRVNALDFNTKPIADQVVATNKLAEANERVLRSTEEFNNPLMQNMFGHLRAERPELPAPDTTAWDEMILRQRESAEAVAGHVANVFGTAFREIFEAGKTGAEKWRAIWHSMIGAVADELERRLFKKLAFSIVDFLLPGGGGVIGKVAGAVAGGGGSPDPNGSRRRGTSTRAFSDATTLAFDQFDFSSPAAFAPRRPATRGGGDRPSVVVNLTLPRGSLIMADDEISMRRWSARLADAAERGVNRTFRGLKPVVQPASVRG